MRWTYKKTLYNIMDWHPWYAWRPIKTKDSLVWLEYVQRKWEPELYFVYEFGCSFPEGGWEYR